MTSANQTTSTNGSESCNTMEGQCNQRMQTAKAILAVKPLVDVNYLDRSATTILAGGSGE